MLSTLALDLWHVRHLAAYVYTFDNLPYSKKHWW